MKILPIPVLSDNYAYVLIDEATNEAGVVDPSEAGPVAAAIKREGVNFTTIINTHHHWDHVGGNKELVQEFPQLKVYGHKRDETRTPCFTNMVDEGDMVRIGNLEARFLFIPCHTSGHIAAYFEAEKSVFTGDTLFIAGCGRLFEGTASDMHNNMVTLMQLPDDTKIYCGHEYTVTNLNFAPQPGAGQCETSGKAALGRGTAGQKSADHSGTVGEEKEINPFVRVDSSELQERVQTVLPWARPRPRVSPGKDPLSER